MSIAVHTQLWQGFILTPKILSMLGAYSFAILSSKSNVTCILENTIWKNPYWICHINFVEDFFSFKSWNKRSWFFFRKSWHKTALYWNLILYVGKKDRHEFSFWRRVKIITQHGAMVLQHVLLQCSRKSVIKCVSKRLCDAFCYKSHWPQLKNVLKIPQEQD